MNVETGEEMRVSAVGPVVPDESLPQARLGRTRSSVNADSVVNAVSPKCRGCGRRGFVGDDHEVPVCGDCVPTAAAGTVAAGAAPAPRPGAAPARGLARLDVVVARVLVPGGGPIQPVDRARAMRLIKDGKVEVSGVGPGEVLEPSRLVSPGDVVVHV